MAIIGVKKRQQPISDDDDEVFFGTFPKRVANLLRRLPLETSKASHVEDGVADSGAVVVSVVADSRTSHRQIGVVRPPSQEAGHPATPEAAYLAAMRLRALSAGVRQSRARDQSANVLQQQ
uniref:Uncharacterized protein n=1 Tax=Plectus sambesii TaxID=2011161 RepID=A0A914WW24_9BILA